MALRICAIAKKVCTSNEEDSTFTYRGELYVKLLKWVHFQKILNLDKSCGFFLQLSTVENNTYLVLCYSKEASANFNLLKLSNNLNFHSQILVNQRKFVIENFFERITDDNNSINIQENLSLEDFYERIKQAHQNENFNFPQIPENVQHSKLKPSTVLRPYQMKGVKWMLKRELLQTKMKTCIVMRSKFKPVQTYYCNELVYELFLNNPDDEFIYPGGGMLCDEMGLGKTVEMISLILLNPRHKGTKRKLDVYEEENIPLHMRQQLIPSKKSIVRCICNKNIKRFDSKKIIICTQCQNAQHVKCVFPREINDEDKLKYTCPLCWKSSNRIVDVPTTIVVCPTSIKKQWINEIKRHVTDTNFKVLLYNGIGSGWISPDEIARYDCVVTDFSTLSKELHFVDANADRELRAKKRFEYPISPLIACNWWRVILDEAQMVENHNNRPSQFSKLLPAKNRWCCTGTPIEKGSVHYLYGLIYFLDVKPYSVDYKSFNRLWAEYKNGYPSKLINMLSPILWRTCKKDVENEIQIPEQSEIIHYIDMSGLQRCFYEQVHKSTKIDFLKYIQDYLWRNSFEYHPETKRKIIDYSLMDKKLSDINNFKTFLESLRKLRQDCTIANLFINVNDQTRTKQTLRAEQLHDHLFSKTSIECKSAMRTIVSSLNGLAALKISQQKFVEAERLYKQVLRYSKDYTGVVSVDSMLSIHSYNGLMEIASLTQNAQELQKVESYKTEMGKLEWKYISNFYSKVQEINEQIKNQKTELQRTSREYLDREGSWWKNIILEHRSADEETKLFDLINTEIFTSTVMQSQIAEQVRSTYGIQLIILDWISKIERYTKEVMKHFSSLDYIILHLCPPHQQSETVKAKIDHLAQSALNCHLNLLEKEDDDDDDDVSVVKPAKSKNKKLCEMCKLKRKLDEYECTLFNKSLVDDIVEGTWNPRMEERLLKIVYNYAKRSNFDFDDESLEMGKKFFKYLEALKNRYKLIAQLWVETNYTISAFDELNMCKMRMQVVDSVDEITEEDARFHFKITKYDVDDQIKVFDSQKQEAEMLFTRLSGRLKYLEHLKERNEVPSCPICTNQPKERYFVTTCGHTICHECFLILTKGKRGNFKISCPICRTLQENSNIYAVACTDTQFTSNIRINGSYSPKIDEIIRCIIQLKQDEPDVKILIFSHWDTILSAIIFGLNQNDIKYRASFSPNFNKQIEEFKDYNQGVTCMMLNLKFGGKGLNLTEATHVFLVEPILKFDEEIQAIGRIHRIGQCRKTFVHKFITKNTMENVIYEKIINDKEKWIHNQFTLRDLENLFSLPNDNDESI